MFYAHPHPSTCTPLSNIFSPANCKQRGAGYANIAWQDAATWSRTHRYDVTWCVNSVCTPSKSLYFSQTSTRWYLALLSRINTYKINDLFQNDTCFHSTPATSANQHYLLNVICAANESEILKAICTELLRHLISSAQWLIICSKWHWVFNQICLKEMGGKKMSPLCAGMKLGVGVCEIRALPYNKESIHQSTEREWAAWGQCGKAALQKHRPKENEIKKNTGKKASLSLFRKQHN